MKKRLLSALLAVCMVMTMAPAAFAAEGGNDAPTHTQKNIARIEQTGEEYPTLAAVSAAVLDNQTITMLENVDSQTDYFTFTNKRDITINLNGKTIKGSGDWAVVYCPTGSKVTIDGTVAGSAIYSYEVGATDGKSGYATTVWSGTDSKVVINGGHYENVITTTQDDHFDLIYANGANASIEILDGTFKNFTPKWTLNLKDNSGASIAVKGGSYDSFDPSAGNTEPAPNNPKNYLAEGYVSVANGDKFEVKPLSEVAVAKIGDKFYRTLEDALNAAADGDTVMVLKDATIGKAVEIDAGTIEVNLNGKTVSYVPSKSNDDLAIIDINGSANVTVTGNGSFTFTNDYFTSKMDELGYIFRLSGDASLTIENGNYHAVLTCVQAGENATATIQGGTFSTEIEWNGTRWHLNLIDNSNAKIIVTGGTFVDYDPSNSQTENPAANFVDPNCIVTREGNNYIVQKIEDKLVVDKGEVEGNTQSATLAGDFAPNAPVTGDKEGSEVKGYDVSLDLSNKGEGTRATTVNLTVTKETAKSLADADSLSVATDAGTVELNAAALDKVGNTAGDVVITIQKNTDAAGGNVKASYTVSVKTDETNLLPYGESNGKVTITVPKGDATVAWYVTGEDANKVYVEKLDTREVGENLAITIGHLSTIELLADDPDATAVATVTTADGKTTGYNTLNEALTATTAGSTIKLLKAVESATAITVPAGATLDGNGKTITCTSTITTGAFLNAGGNNVTIKNVTINTAGHVKHGVQFYCVNGGKLSNATVNGGSYTSVIVNGSTDITLEDCTLNPDESAYTNVEYAMGSGVTAIPSMTLDNVSFDSSKLAVWADKNTVAGMKKNGTDITDDNVAETIKNNVASKNNSSFDITVQTGAGADDVTTVTKPNTKPSTGGSSSSGSSNRTLTFNVNGGSELKKLTKAKGTTIDLSDYTPTRAGYTFAGWYSDKELTDKVTSIKLSENTTVYAKWTKNADETVAGFEDVKVGDWFAEEVQYVVDKGLMSGTSKTTFAPSATTTRGMIVAILHRLEKEPAATASAFTDVKAGAYYEKAINWAAANDIVKGVTETTFAPDQAITREQMAAILYRYAQFKGYDMSKANKLDAYADAAQVSAYAVPAMQWANAENLITGKSATVLDPKGNATRAEVSSILMRFCENIAK